MNTNAMDKREALIRRLLARDLGKKADPAHQGNTRTPIVRADRAQPLPLSWAQQRLWFLAQLDPDASAAYHMPAALRLKGTLDSAALTATLDRIVARHEILRTTFVKTDEGEPVQVIAAAAIGFCLTRHDLRDLAETERHAAIGRLSADVFQHPFDLERGPLIRGRLLQLADDDHILLFCQHHIVSDGWSIGILVREITALYAAFVQALPDPLTPLDLQYADYALWQRQSLQGDALQRQIEFWRAHLAEAPALLELPTDYPRPARQRYKGASVALVLPADLTTALRAFSQRHGTTLFMTLLAGWSILLARMSGQNDVVVGTPIANRQRLEIESLIGFFVNTLALRIRLDDEPTVTQLLQRIKATTLAAYAHQDVPFEQVVEALLPARSLSYNPIFQARFTWHDTVEASGLRLSGLTLEMMHLQQTTTTLDLSLILTDAGETIVGTLEYATALFEADSVGRCAAQLVALLRAMVANDQQRIQQLPLLSPAECHRLLVEWNATQAPYSGQLIQQRFEAQAAAEPDAPALTCQDQCLTYSQLNTKANHLAHYLLSLGIRPDDRVAICTARGLDMVVGLLGVLKAGGAYVPLDPDYPEERLAFMLLDSAPVALLTHASLLERLPAMSVLRVIVLDDPDTQAVLASHSSDNINPSTIGLTPEHLAYVIYTSGSTGKPKGVMNIHRGLANLANAQIDLFDVRPNSRVLQFASFSFDASVWEVVMALGSGACLHLASREALQPGEPLATTLQQNQITHVTLPPSVLATLPAAATFEPLTLIVAGEDCPAALAQQWAARHRLFNAYGPTETTVCASTYRCQPDQQGLVPIGRPIPNATLYVLDAQRQPVPIGVTGELYIGGVQVARGYLNRPELTQERFLPDPFSADPTARLYKTGDLGRYLPDGNLVFLGRNDFQVKIRGFRIELGEIEAQLLTCQGVREAVVSAREDSPADKRLVAYLVPEEEAQLSISQLRAHLTSVLPEYMVPAAYVTLPSLPLTPNGKVDRRALPAPQADAHLKRTYAPPTGEIEIAIAAIWQDLLHIQQVGRHDHFFELGGHSLLAVQLVSRLRQVLGADVALRDLFATPTLADFAKHVAQAAALVLPPIRPAERTQNPPLSWAQRRLWFLTRLDPAASVAYHMPAALQLRGTLDHAALATTLDRIVARHDILRTTFVPTADGEPVQAVTSPNVGFVLSRHDLRDLGDSEQKAAVARLSEDEFQRPFDLARGPLIRGALLQLADDDHILLVCQHHIISDAWSVRILVR
ncbi:MAG TPA: amino acid adenylation domain-containing protein, partial [Steroidobacteraceae bacterium]